VCVELRPGRGTAAQAGRGAYAGLPATPIDTAALWRLLPDLDTSGIEFAVQDGVVDQGGGLQVRAWPDLSFSTIRLQYGDDFFVHEMDVWGTPRELTDPEGVRRTSTEPVHYDMVDVIQIRGGLVYRKDTYVDAMAILFGTHELGGART
jgi:hypothetical protein